MTTPLSRFLARAAALLYLLSMVTGALAGLSLSGQLPADGHIVLGAHVSALTGALMLLGFAYTTPMLRYTDAGLKRLAWAFIVASYSNWAISTAKAFPAVHGVGLTGRLANDVVFVLLGAFVVAPTFVAAVAWVWGFKKE